MLCLVSGLVAFGCVAAALVQKDLGWLIAALVALGFNVTASAFGLWLRAMNGGAALSSSSPVAPVSHSPFAPPSSNLVDEDVRALARGGRKIEAIKLFRERHGGGLKDAKDAVERMAK